MTWNHDKLTRGAKPPYYVKVSINYGPTKAFICNSEVEVVTLVAELIRDTMARKTFTDSGCGPCIQKLDLTVDEIREYSNDTSRES